jgi:hypothetical protein
LATIHRAALLPCTSPPPLWVALSLGRLLFSEEKYCLVIRWGARLHKSDGRIHQVITSGIKGEMPSFAKTLNDDIRALTVYIFGRSEPDALPMP